MNKVIILTDTSCAGLEKQVNSTIQDINNVISIQFQTCEASYGVRYSCMIHYAV